MKSMIFLRKIESGGSISQILDRKTGWMVSGFNPLDPWDGFGCLKKAQRNSSANLTSLREPLIQGLLKLLWTVYSKGKLQSCLKLRNFQNPFNKDKTYHAQKKT